MDVLTVPAYAKLNLSLDILRRREDGYHDLEMIMQSISLHDDVTVKILEEGIYCHTDMAGLPTDENNLAVKAAKTFFAETGMLHKGVDIRLTKRIPVQAGMAGGSTDAASVLRALRQLCMPTLPERELERIGALVGSDVPYCIRGGTAFVQGRGEILTSLCRLPRLSVVVCKPQFSVETPVLFSRVCVDTLKHRPNTTEMLCAIENGDLKNMFGQVKNVFEEVLQRKEQKEIRRIKEKLRELGADAASMTGSGPTVFGLFQQRALAQGAYEDLKPIYQETYLAEFV